MKRALVFLGIIIAATLFAHAQMRPDKLPPLITDALAGPPAMLQVAGAGVAPAAGATDYTEDANIISWWYFEEASSPRLDGSANDNNLSDGSSGGPDRSATAIQGSYSADFEADNYDSLTRADADLYPSTFPGKATTGGQGAFTVMCWFRLESINATQGVMGKGTTGTEDLSWNMSINSSNYLQVFLSERGWENDLSVTGTTVLSTGTWYHATLVYTGSALQLWLGTESTDSAQDNTAASGTVAIRRDDGPFVIGAVGSNGSSPLDGLIDEVAIFSDALSGTEINEIRANGLDGSR